MSEFVAKEKMMKIISEQPSDSSYDEIMRELAFHRMIERGINDSKNGKIISHGEMGKKIEEWRQK